MPAILSLHPLRALRVPSWPRIALKAPRDLRAPSVLRVKSFSFAARIAALLLLGAFIADSASIPQANVPRSYLGFDRNIYPGDAALPLLHKSFAFIGYWLSPPPGEKTNTWKGKRGLLVSQGFGFALLCRGPASSELKKAAEATQKGALDAQDAAASAKAEGFPQGSIIFLDIEEGGRLPAAYHAYLHGWSSGLDRAGYRPGAYGSGIPVQEELNVSITTADDIHNDDASHDIIMWAYNDACPPSPGCTFPQSAPPPSASGISYAAVWQFAQSPRRKEFTSRCAATYNRDGNCYAPADTAHAWFLDVNSASSPDPSEAN